MKGKFGMLKNEIHFEVPESILNSWQEIVDILAEIGGIPAALIMRLQDQDIEVFVTSRSAGNPYKKGSRENVWGSGLYCEKVIRTGTTLLVPNAPADKNWAKNPDIKLNMISYLGLPILYPDHKPFGTICVLDNKENRYTDKFEKLMSKFRDLIQVDLEILYMNQMLGDSNKRLTDYLEELHALRGLVPICANCKSIRDEEGSWHPVEEYLAGNPQLNFSHDICPTCMKKLYPDLDDDKNI
jgi:transcriptional regulator with GAF, ATPase, and Fis domain